MPVYINFLLFFLIPIVEKYNKITLNILVLDNELGDENNKLEAVNTDTQFDLWQLVCK